MTLEAKRAAELTKGGSVDRRCPGPFLGESWDSEAQHGGGAEVEAKKEKPETEGNPWWRGSGGCPSMSQDLRMRRKDGARWSRPLRGGNRGEDTLDVSHLNREHKVASVSSHSEAEPCDQADYLRRTVSL